MKRQVSIPNSNPQSTSSQQIQQLLISSVQTFLRQKKNIQINLPRLHSLIDKKVNLKITSIPLSKDHTSLHTPSTSAHLNANQNRYKIMMQYIQLLLSSSTLDLKAMEGFMGYFTKVIDNDVEIIQRNEVIRRSSFKIKQKLQFKVQQISKKTDILNTAIQKLHDKQDILNFIAIDIKNYLLSVKLISDQYQQVRMVQVFTPLKIDDIYQFQLSSQEDYNDHYQPLLQVLIRLRSNMQNLFHNVKTCDRIDMPLKSVNLLANCKNLLTQLQQYLISDHCAFNRLIFHVVTQQSQNMKLIASFYQHYLQYVRQLVFNVFKCVYEGHLFKVYYLEFGEQLKQLNKKIVDLIMKIDVGDGSNRSQVYNDIQTNLGRLEISLQQLRDRIKVVEKVLCFDKTAIMKFYLEEKICKKLGLLLKQKGEVFRLKKMLVQARKYIKQVKLIEQKIKQFPKIKNDLQKEIKEISTSQSLKQQKVFLQKIQDNKSDPYQKKFEQNFILIQNKNLQISALQRSIKLLEPDCTQKQIKQQYFPRLQQQTISLKQKYSQLQSALLESYQHMLADQTEQQIQANKNANQTIKEIAEYLLSQDKDEQGTTYTSIGAQILNQDIHCQTIKKGLEDIDKAEYKIKSIRTKNRSKQSIQKAKQNIKKLQMLRKYLQWLLVLYEGSMDENILLNVVDKMDFNQTSDPAIQKNMAKVQQLMKQVEKYNRELKRIGRQIKMTKPQQKEAVQNKINNKMAKIIRDRQNLYEIIQILYGQFLSVYSDIKNPLKSTHKAQAYDFQSKGIQLFNKKLFDYALLCYHSLNKISVTQKQLNDSNLIASSKNFINDDLLEPYANRLQSYLKFSESEMLELTLGLQKSIRIEKQYKNEIRKFQEAVGYGAQDQTSLKKLKQKCQQFIQLQTQIVNISELGKKKFVILNIDDLKKIDKECEQHFMIAKQIGQTQIEQLSKIGQNKTFKSQKLTKAVKQLQKNSHKK